MDLNRYDQISGLEALKMILNGEEVFNTEDGEKMLKYYLKNDLIVYDRDKQKAIGSLVTVNRLLMSSDWYIKKPFDVRKEMLARPNEWVGAYSVGYTWYKVGLCSVRMGLVITTYNSSQTPAATDISPYIHSLNHCIPIEDVQKEDLL